MMFTAFLFTDDVISQGENNLMRSIEVTEIIIYEIQIVELNLQVIQVTQII